MISLNAKKKRLILQAVLPQVDFTNSNGLDVYVIDEAPHHEDIWKVEV